MSAAGAAAQTGDIMIAAPPPATPDEPPCCRVAAGTLVDIEILDGINSKTHHHGDKFRIKLAEPILVDGKILVAAGTPGEGEVVHAAKARAGGKPGELILAARYLETSTARLPLRGFKFGKSGQDNGDAAFAVAIFVAWPAAFLVSGGNVDVPLGTRATAKLAMDVTLAAPE